VALRSDELVRRVLGSGSGRSVAGVDACGRPAAGRRGTDRAGLRGAGEALGANPNQRTKADASRSGVADAGAEARKQLELRGNGTSGARQRGVPAVCASGIGEGTRRQGHRQDRQDDGAGGGGEDSSPHHRSCQAGGCGERAADACGHYGGRDQHSLPDRQQPAGRWSAGTDAADEEGGERSWGIGRRSTKPDADGGEEGGGDRHRQPPGNRCCRKWQPWPSGPSR